MKGKETFLCIQNFFFVKTSIFFLRNADSTIISIFVLGFLKISIYLAVPSLNCSKWGLLVVGSSSLTRD